jgi:hypothetical protein
VLLPSQLMSLRRHHVSLVAHPRVNILMHVHLMSMALFRLVNEQDIHMISESYEKSMLWPQYEFSNHHVSHFTYPRRSRLH